MSTKAHKDISQSQLKPLDLGGFIFVDEYGNEEKIPFVLPELEKVPEGIYANHVVINHTPFEFNLLFGRMQSPMSKEQMPKNKKIEIPLVAKIILPPEIARQLRDILAANIENFEKIVLEKK